MASSPKNLITTPLTSTFTTLMATKADLVAKRGDVDKPAKDAQGELDDYIKKISRPKFS